MHVNGTVWQCNQLHGYPCGSAYTQSLEQNASMHMRVWSTAASGNKSELCTLTTQTLAEREASM